MDGKIKFLRYQLLLKQHIALTQFYLKIQVEVFPLEIYNIILKSIWKGKGKKMAKTILKKNEGVV
jgi:hypothetical protein